MRALALVLFACGAAPRPVAPADGVLAIRCRCPDAHIWVDGSLVARVRDASGGLAMAPGTHRIILKQPGFHDTYALTEVVSGETVTLNLSLARRYE